MNTWSALHAAIVAIPGRSDFGDFERENSPMIRHACRMKVKENRVVVLAAVIAAAAAIIGAAIGGFIPYLGVQHVENSKSEEAARGVARVLSSRFQSADVRLEFMLTKNRWVAPDETFEIAIPFEDEKLLASRLSGNQWSKVASAMAILSDFSTIDDRDVLLARTGQIVPLSDSEKIYVRDTQEAIRAGIESLNLFAEEE